MSSPLPDNPYEILGVSKDAQLPEIRSAHRKRVLKCHPDKVQDPALKAEKQNEFQKVQQAYEILSDETEREKYDNQVRVAELRKQAAAQAKANSSVPRSSRSAAPEFEVHFASPRPSNRSSPSAASPQVFTKVYYSSRSHSDDDRRAGPRVYDAEPPRPTPARRESSFAEREARPSKRESERERERERDRDRAERERERRKRADKEAKAAKDAKEAKREEKKQREKQMAKEIKRQQEDKRRYMTPEEDVPPPRMEKKSSSSRKYEPREPSLERDRDFGYNDFGVDAKSQYAESYINAARISGGGAPRRSKTYHGRTPYVPSPPPPQGVASAYPSPDEDEPRRSAATSRRRGSADAPKPSREKSYSKPSRERLDEDPIVMEARAPSSFHKSMSSTAAATAGLSTSPPRPLPRTNTMPTEATFSRPAPGMARSKTFTEGASPRGRTRSKMEPQVEIESEDEDVYEQERERRARDREARDGRDRKHRSSKKHRSPDRYREEPRAVHTSYTYSLNEEGGAPKTKLSRTYTRQLDRESDLYDTYGGGARYVERPPPGVREPSYSSAYGQPPMTKFPKVRTTKLDDVAYSKYPATYAV